MKVRIKCIGFCLGVWGLTACHSAGLEKKLLEDAYVDWTREAFCEFLGEVYTDSLDMTSCLKAHLRSDKGWRPLDLDSAFVIVSNNNHRKVQKQWLLFEVTGSSKVIFPLSGNGLWAGVWCFVVVDTVSDKIVKVVFDHESETPGSGAEITTEKFSGQFKDRELVFGENCFALYQEGDVVLKGVHRVDGISGATITSKAVIEMVNQGLRNYEKELHSILEATQID